MQHKFLLIKEIKNDYVFIYYLKQMRTLNKDEIYLLALKLDLPSLLSLCLSCNTINYKIDNNVWYAKLNLDFPDYKDIDWKMNPRDIYRLIYFLKIMCNSKVDIVDLYNSGMLNLCNRNLKQIPKEIYKLSNLQELYLSHNSLTEISKEIINLSNLQKLALNNNKLSEIPKEIGNLSNLQFLHLSYNNITKIPNEVTMISELQCLYLADNYLIEIPKEIGNLCKLEILSLSNNNLTRIPKEIDLLSNLQDLFLYDNKFTEIPNFNNKRIRVYYKNRLPKMIKK